MMSSTTAVICLCAFYILTTTEATAALMKQTDNIPDGIKNVLFHNERIYVADGFSQLYIYNTNLTLIKIIETGETNVEEDTVTMNINKILLINEYADGLIMCGTGFEGRCQLRALSDIGKIKYTSHDTVVYDDEGGDELFRPAVGFVTPAGNLMLGVTFGTDLYFISGSNVSYPITNRVVDFDAFGDFGDMKQRIWLQRNEYLPEYLIYFKDAFQINGFSYFVTNQKRYFNDVAHVSKLVRICQNDTTKYFNSYADVELSCMNGKVSYNLIQDVLVVNSSRDGHIFLAAFTKGTDPENPSGDSVICYTRMNQLDAAIMQAKKNFVTCKSQISENQRYYRNFLENCLSEEEYQKEDVICSTSKSSFKYVIGVVPVKLTLGIRLSSSKGYITTLSSRTVGGDRIYILAGTSRGNLIKMNFIGMNDPLYIYAEQRIAITPIVSIHSKGLDLYIATSYHVFKYATDCSELSKSCEVTMRWRNPHCGWCVYRRRSTLMEECSNGTNHWLSSTGKCIGLKARTERNHNNPALLNVLLNVTNLPVNADYTTYFCKYKMKNVYINNGTQFFARHEGIGHFTCNAPNVTDQTKATLEFWTASRSGVHKSVLLARTSFPIFNCSRYLTCRACTNTPYPDCQWCSASLTCQAPTSPCDGQLIQQTYDACPHLLSNPVYFVPSGIEKTVTFPAKHLDVSSGIRYTCNLQSLNIENDEIVNDALNWNKTSVLCNINIAVHTTVTKVVYKLDIKYGNHRGKMLVLDDKCNKTVTIYRCEMLAKDCTQCGALKSTRYQCGWCDDNCGYTDGLCNQTCSRPIITKIVLHDGPRQGGTRVTMYGTDIGVTLSDIKSIHVGHTKCTDVSVTLGNDNTDFIQPVIQSIGCKTGPIANKTLLGRKGPVSIQAGSQTIEAMSMFTYQEMAISSISPTYGIVSGGTHVTIYGQHLGIGNREVRVMFGPKMINAQVYPNLPLNVTSESVNFTIQFITPILVDNMQTLAIVNTKEDTNFANATIGYNTVMDPVINKIYPKQSFFSGGTVITIKGKNLTNAHEATLRVDDDEDPFYEKCFFKTATKADCKVPPYTEYLRNKYYTEHEDIFVTVAMVLALDGMKTQFGLQYNLDPVFETINNSSDDEETNVIVIEPGEHLTIKGKHFDSIPKVTDISVTIGMDDCKITDTTNTNISCISPHIQPQPVIQGALYPEIKVTVGNINVTVGYVKYVDQVAIEESTSLTIIGVAVGISVGLVVKAVIVGTVVFKKSRKRFEKLQNDTANQRLQMNRMENMLQEAHAQLEVVENEINAGQYADIDDIAINCPYEETGIYNTIAEQGYHEQDHVSTTSSYFEFLPENDTVEVHDNREVYNESRSSSYQELLPVSERVEVHFNRDSDNKSSSSSYAEVLAASDRVVVTTSDYLTVLPERVLQASDRVEDHCNRESDNESSSSSYQEVLAANDRVVVTTTDYLTVLPETVLPASERVEDHCNPESYNESSSSSYQEVLAASDKVVVTTSKYLTVLQERMLPASEREEIHCNRESDNESSSSNLIDI